MIEYLLIDNYLTTKLFEDAENKMIKNKVKHFMLIKRSEKTSQLTYRERSRTLVRCLHEKEIIKILRLLHEVHDYFLINIIMQKTMKRFY